MVSDNAVGRWSRRTIARADIPKPMRDFDKSHDYVGPEGWRARLVPNRIHGVDVNFAAFWHDRLYFLGGSEADRLFADREFLAIIGQQLIATCRGFRFLLLPFAMIRAMVYYRAVRRLGKGCFNYHQQEESE